MKNHSNLSYTGVPQEMEEAKFAKEANRHFSKDKDKEI
jgi:hypothetical protein